MYKDGVGFTVSGTINLTIADIAAIFRVGYNQTYNKYINGAIEEFRLSTTARYGGVNFTPETAPYTAPPAYSDNDTYVLISSAQPDILDTYVDGVQVLTLDST